jgi:streptogramin lyase
MEDRCLMSGIFAMAEYSTLSNGGSTNNERITSGPDGNLWFTCAGNSTIGVINPTTDAIGVFPTPTAGSDPQGITAGPDGNVWFTEYTANNIGMINPKTHAITEFAVPTRHNSFGVQAIAAGPDGNLWFTVNGNNTIGMINPTTHAITEFAVPTSNSGPWGITAGPDGNLWFTESAASKIGVINPTTHAITEFPIPTGGAAPYEITQGPGGNLWFGMSATTYQIGEIDPATHAITQFATNLGAGVTGEITAGPDGNVWFGELGPRNIARINPTTGAVTEYPAYPTIFQPHGITTGPDGNLWVSDGRAAVGVATLATSQLVVTQPPPASVAAGGSFGLSVTAEDSSGNPITSFNGTVTVALGNDENYSGSVTLGGTVTVTASNGVANFSGLTLSDTTAGHYYSLYTYGGGYGWGVTGTITIIPGAASQLVITQQPPASVRVSSQFGFQASIEDQYGNVVTTASNTMSVGFANNPTGATLGGTLSVTASQGVATFSNLTINQAGNGYTLQVSSTGLTGATSTGINVNKKGASILGSPPASSSAVDPVLGPLVVDTPDLWDGLRPRRHPR